MKKMPSSSILLMQTLIFFTSLATLCAATNNDGGKGSTVDGELWCVAKNNAEDAALQSALDWACGAGGANCAPIQPNGQCYDPSDIVLTASYAFNDYFLKHGMASNTCDFSHSAQLTSLNLSFGNCKIPSSSNGSKGSSTGTVGGGIVPSSADSGNASSVLGRSRLAVVSISLFFIILMIDLTVTGMIY